MLTKADRQNHRHARAHTHTDAHTTSAETCLPNHAVPNPINFLPVLPIGHQVKVVGEADNLGQSLEDVDAEALAALLHGSHALVDGTVRESKCHVESLGKNINRIVTKGLIVV